jgi:TetR/AcrR family transcriptional repressor of nem operon
MRVSREQVAVNRQKILDVASQLFRERGFDSVTVADVMGAAGFTHGGFYSYFESKDDLVAQALAHVMAQIEASENDIAAYAARYLSSRHRDNPSKGCPIAALGCETARQSPEARVALAKGIQARIERFAESMSTAGMENERARRAAIGGMAAMVGAMILARLTDDKAFSADLLDETRAWITENAGGRRS